MPITYSDFQCSALCHLTPGKSLIFIFMGTRTNTSDSWPPVSPLDLSRNWPQVRMLRTAKIGNFDKSWHPSTVWTIIYMVAGPATMYIIVQTVAYLNSAVTNHRCSLLQLGLWAAADNVILFGVCHKGTSVAARPHFFRQDVQWPSLVQKWFRSAQWHLRR